MSRLQETVNASNHNQTRLLVLMIGRELVIQNIHSYFRQHQHILHVLPYFLTKEEIQHNNYIDDHNLLEQDQRQTWWNNYGNASGRGYICLPTELDQSHFIEITSQPLLNYLLALIYQTNQYDFSKLSNVSKIYADLLTRVYDKLSSDNKLHIFGVREYQFVHILQSIAVAAWHGGDDRITTLSEIQNNCVPNIIPQIFNIFNQNQEARLTRFLTAFFVRQHGVTDSQINYKFTQKEIGNYLTAKFIVTKLKLIHQNLTANEQYSSEGWNKQRALQEWAQLCGSAAMDKSIFQFLVSEISLHREHYQVNVAKWQKTMCDLISYMLRNGMPMEQLNLTNFQEANRQARNAEEALLAVWNACARVTQKTSQIKWPSPEAFGNWISRLRGQRVDFEHNIFCLTCLSYLDLKECILSFQDFYRANLQNVILEQANLREANLQEANLAGANLYAAQLVGANLEKAQLQWANLEGAKFRGANLKSANCEKATIGSGNFECADIQEANFQEAYLKRANFAQANLAGANLQKADLERANLQGANLAGANLAGANLVGVNLQDVNLQGANLQGAKLKEDNPVVDPAQRSKLTRGF